jgi:hypothetical protein
MQKQEDLSLPLAPVEIETKGNFLNKKILWEIIVFKLVVGCTDIRMYEYPGVRIPECIDI